jgi:hypothetical protein
VIGIDKQLLELMLAPDAGRGRSAAAWMDHFLTPVFGGCSNDKRYLDVMQDRQIGRDTGPKFER